MDLPTPDERTRWRWVVAALLGAVLAWALGPRAWPSGAGAFRLWHGDTLLHDGPVLLGKSGPQDGAGNARGHAWRWSFPAGFPTDGEVRGSVAVHGEGRRAGLDMLRAELVLPDGRVEPLPLVQPASDADGWTLRRRTPAKVRFMLALLAFVVVLWVSEAVPLWVTSVSIPVFLSLGGVASPQHALAPFFHPIIALFFGGLLMAEAMKRVRLDHFVAMNIVARAAGSPVMLYAAVLGTSAFLSMWMSNTASTALLIPIAMSVTAPLGNLPYRRALVLGLAYAATVGGIGSAIGTPANLLAIEFLGTYANHRTSFVAWFAVGLPVVVLLLPIVGAYLWLRMGVRVDRAALVEARRAAREALASSAGLSRAQGTVLLVFFLVISCWLTQQWHGVHPGIVALGGAALLATLGRVRSEDLGAISWPALLTFGGGLALGLQMVESGTSDWVATRLGGPLALPPTLGLFSVALLALFLTSIASNTASAAILIPLSIPLAGVLGLDIPTLVLVVAVASSVDFAMVIGTPPTMLAYATRMYSAGWIFRAGVVLDLAGVVLLVTVVTRLWRWLGVVGGSC